MASTPPMEGDVSRNQALEDTRYFPGKFSLRDRGRFSREITSLVCPRQRPAIPCLSTGQGQRGEGQSKVEGTSLEPPPFLPPLSLSLEAPSTKRVRLFSRFCRDSSDPFVRFQCLAFELDSSFPSCPTPNVLAPETEGRYIARGEL